MTTDWIEVNLPIRYRMTDDEKKQFDILPYPSMKERATKEFGTSIEKSRSTISQAEFDSYRSYHDQLSVKYSDSSDDYSEKINSELMNSNDEAVKKVLIHQKLVAKIQEWESMQPEIVEWCKNCEDITAKKREYVGAREFGYSRPGVLVEVEVDGDIKQRLIGHANPLWGVCDDCVEFEPETIVKRYKVIWEEYDYPKD